ncbi:MAG: protein-disulfide reductase DsbD N-terminal domain-containing protein [Flavobacteriales bacterium]
MRGLWMFFIFLGLGFNSLVFSQNHVSWNAKYDKESCQLVIHGTIDPSWHLYSPKTKGSLGPIPLSAQITATDGIKPKGSVRYLTEAQAHQDENFGGMVYTWENTVELSQKLSVKQSGEIKITLNYMVCDETRCLPPIDKTWTLNIHNE